MKAYRSIVGEHVGSSRLRAASAATGQQLAAALAACRKHKARLVVARLDRLSRNVAFLPR